MERARQVSGLWNWLPSFRAVAETEHLPTASNHLHVSASALSRTIRLLEEQVGVPLFDRVGRNLHLNSEGRAMLKASRDAMRIIEDALGVIGAQSFSGPIHISAAGSITNVYLTNGLQNVHEKHPDLIPHVYQCDVQAAHEKLLRGQLDIALHEEPAESADLIVEPIGETTSGVYCGRGHPLFGKNTLTIPEATQHDFVAPMIRRGKPPEDGWPPALYRKIGFRVSHMHLAIGMALKGDHLIVLPDDVAKRYVQNGDFYRLPIEAIQPMPIFVSRRTPMIEDDRITRILSIIREGFQD